MNSRKTVRKAVLFAIVLYALGLTAFPQGQAAEDAIAKANSDKARALIDQMIKALGGNAWLSLKDSTFEGRTSGFYQGKPTGAVTDYVITQRTQGPQRIELGKKRDVVEIFSGSTGWEITYRGKKELPRDQVEEFIRRRDHSVDTAVRVWLKDPNTILIFDRQSLVERHLADQVTLINSDNDSITIQMDAQDHLPLRRSFQWRDPLYKDKNEDAEEYDDYHSVSGIPTPYTITRFHNGDMVNQRFLYRASYNNNPPDAAFDPDATAQKIKK